MAFSIDGVMKIGDFAALKGRVKTEMLKRNGNGSLTAYGGAAYDYITPMTGQEVPLKEEHFDKIRDVLANINTAGLPGPLTAGDIIIGMDILEAKMTAFEAQPRAATTNNDCASACSGVCVSTCDSTCLSGCLGSCKDTCQGNCYGGCKDTCQGCSGCGDGCSTSCYGCDAGCGGVCASSCSGGCKGGCFKACNFDCGASCIGCAQQNF